MLFSHGMHNGMWLLLSQAVQVGTSSSLKLDLIRRPEQVQYPAFPTTTIGSFPQVGRKCRRLLQSIKLGQGCGVMCRAPIVWVPGMPSLLRLAPTASAPTSARAACLSSPPSLADPRHSPHTPGLQEGSHQVGLGGMQHVAWIHSRHVLSAGHGLAYKRRRMRRGQP